MSDSSSSPSTGNSPSSPSLGSDSSPPTNDSEDSPSSNSSPPSNSSTPADNSKGSPDVDSSPPSPTSTSPPPEDDSQDSPPSTSSPPSSSSSTPPSSKASPPPPISSPPPPEKDTSPSTPPPTKKDDSPSTPPPPINNNNSPPPPKEDDSSSTPPPPPPKEDDSSSTPPPPINTNNSPPPPPPPSSKSNSPPPPPPPTLPPPTTNGSQPSASSSSPPPPNLEPMPPSSSSQSSNAPPPPNVIVVVSPPPPRAISPPLSDTETSSSLEPTRPSSAMDSPSSSSSQESTKESPGPSHSGGSGTLIGVAASVMVLMLVALFLVRKRKRRRLDKLDHRPPPALSIRSDGSYYRQTNPMGGSIRSESYQPSQQFSGGASGSMVGSNKYGYPSGPLSPNGPTGLKSWFTYEELMDATNGFSKENMIGEGGFGCVYKGVISDGRRVAVKQLKAGSGQGEREFRAEVEIISRVHHRHLVSLVGYCIAEYHRLLVYEFLPNNTLEHHLHGLPVMDWQNRRRIAIGAAKGLAYLHEDCHPRIIHRDIKSANILLEDSFEPQVADFGLAKLSNETHTHVSTRVMGTFGYMAPEYASSGKLTDRSDVFSFGVVLLEIITGRKPVDTTQPLGDESLVEWARPLLVHALETGNCDELVDQRLENNYNRTEMFVMIEAAAACVRHSAPKRPRMVQVMRALDNLDEKQDLSNGVKFGESQAFNSNQYSADIRNFHRLALHTDSFSYQSGEYDRRSSASSGEFRSHEQRPRNSHESAARPIYRTERSS